MQHATSVKPIISFHPKVPPKAPRSALIGPIAVPELEPAKEISNGRKKTWTRNTEGKL